MVANLGLDVVAQRLRLHSLMRPFARRIGRMDPEMRVVWRWQLVFSFLECRFPVRRPVHGTLAAFLLSF